MELTFDRQAMMDAVIDRAAENLVGELADARGLVREAVKARVDSIFKKTAEREIDAAVSSAIKEALDREYFAVDAFGHRRGEATTISKQLDRIVGGYWSEKVGKDGKPTQYGDSITRAEYLMMKVCAEDFSTQMRQAAVSVTAALKDGFRAQMAGHVDKLLDELFRVKSLQDQNKAAKPW